MSSVKSAQYFDDHIKVVEVIIQKTCTGQINRTIMMNSHRKRFHASIRMVEIQERYLGFQEITQEENLFYVRKLQKGSKDFFL